MRIKVVLKAALLLFLFISASVATIVLVNMSMVPNYTKIKPTSLVSDFSIVEPTGGDIIDDPVAPG